MQIAICSIFAQMNGVLYSYLLQHKSISIPGLGTIFVERSPAKADFPNRRVLPPRFQFGFDKYFDAPDKDFFGYLSNQQAMADYEAMRWYNEWAFDLRNQIKSNHPVNLPGVGILKKDLSGEIIFEPDSDVKSWLGPAPATKVIHANDQHTLLVGDREISSGDIVSYRGSEAKYIEKESWWVYALILAAIGLIVLFFHLYKNGLGVNSTGNQQRIEAR
jgi:hypothetical protein